MYLIMLFIHLNIIFYILKFHILIILLMNFFKIYNLFQILLNYDLFHLNFHLHILIKFNKVVKMVNILYHILY